MTNEKENNKELARLRKTLQSVFPPIIHLEPQRDLWPHLLQRIAEPPPGVSLRMPWFDWALLGIAAAALLFFPAVLPALFYHL